MRKFIITAILVIYSIVNCGLLPQPVFASQVSNQRVKVASEAMSLENRARNRFVNDVFKKNILLTLSFLADEDRQENERYDLPSASYVYDLKLNPEETFAFHEDVLPKYQGKVVKTTGAHFEKSDGFWTDGRYYGDGVCHLASLINKAATEAGLSVEAPSNHNFARIPDIEWEYGTAIFFIPGRQQINARKNLYVTNSFDKPVHLVFSYDNNAVTVEIFKED